MTTIAATFQSATRIHTALTADIERRTLLRLAARTPRAITSDHLTALALAAQIAAGIFYAIARTHHAALLAVCLCIALNWFGDSLDGTLARVRNQQRPRFGFYVDHASDLLGTVALLTGLGASGFIHWPIAAAMLVTFLLLAAESFLATHTLGRFELSQFLFGPTELRLLLIAGTLALLHNPYAHILGHQFLLFDLGGTIGAACMSALAILTIAKHTAQLYKEEPLA